MPAVGRDPGVGRARLEDRAAGIKAGVENLKHTRFFISTVPPVSMQKKQPLKTKNVGQEWGKSAYKK